MTTPIEFLREAIKAVPAVKYALGVGGIIATVAIVYSFKLDPRIAAFGAIVMLILMGVLVIFARMASLASTRMTLPAIVFTWFVLLIFIAVSVLLFTSVFFQKPLDLSYFLVGTARGAATSANPIVQAARSGTGDKPNLQDLLSELESTSVERRIHAASGIANIHPRDQIEADSIVRVLESYINRRGALEQRSSNDSQHGDIAAAFLSLSSVLRYSKDKSFDIRPPEFQRLYLSSIDLTNSYLPGATFRDSALNDAVLNGADFSNTVISGIQFSRVQARGIKFGRARIQNSCSEESSFAGAELTKAIASSSDFNGSNFKDADLSGARFENSRIAYANFDGASLAHSDLRGALELSEQQLKAARLTDTAMLPDPIFVKSHLTICNVR